MTTPASPKQIKSIVFEGWDVPAYGPQGKHTRQQWRKECLDNLLAGKDSFKVWQDSWQKNIDKNINSVSFEMVTTYKDGSTRERNPGLLNNLVPYSLDFIGHSFNHYLDCSSFEFKYKTHFSYAVFRKTAIFEYAVFSENALFMSSIFCGNAIFKSVSFNKSAFFYGMTFEDYTNFSSATFSGLVAFSGGEFKRGCFFNGVTFGKKASFFKTKFTDQCRFESVEKTDDLTLEYLRETWFLGSVNFENALFENVGHFEQTRFKCEIPNFLGVDNSKTLLIFSDDSYFNKNDISEDAVKRLGQLKRLSDEQGQTDQALMFNAFELNAKAKLPDASKILKITTGAYELVSDYGRSFTRPIFWYGFLIWFSFLFAMGNPLGEYAANKEAKKACVEVNDKGGGLSKVQAAFEYAMFRAGGVLDFTDTDKQNNVINCQLFDSPYEPPVLRAWGIFKGIASIALLFLAALGLRNKYRIK